MSNSSTLVPSSGSMTSRFLSYCTQNKGAVAAGLFGTMITACGIYLVQKASAKRDGALCMIFGIASLLFAGIRAYCSAQSPSSTQSNDDAPRMQGVSSQYQERLRSDIQSMEVDLTLLQPEALDNQLAIAKVVQSMALPFYKNPMPMNPSRQSLDRNERIQLPRQDEGTYANNLNRIQNKEIPARWPHGTMHCVRVALWTQVLSNLYEKFGRTKPKDPVLLATAGAMHDVAREDEGVDYWDEESSEVLRTLLVRANIDEPKIETYVHTIKEKDPADGNFATDEQMIVHDADCLDILRCRRKNSFEKGRLCFYHFGPDKTYFDDLIEEVYDFIQLTENLQVRRYLEHYSDDFYGDLVRVLFAMKKGDDPRFPLICGLVQQDMQEILSTQTESSDQVLSLLCS